MDFEVTNPTNVTPHASQPQDMSDTNNGTNQDESENTNENRRLSQPATLSDETEYVKKSDLQLAVAEALKNHTSGGESKQAQNLVEAEAKKKHVRKCKKIVGSLRKKLTQSIRSWRVNSQKLRSLLLLLSTIYKHHNSISLGCFSNLWHHNYNIFNPAQYYRHHCYLLTNNYHCQMYHSLRCKLFHQPHRCSANNWYDIPVIKSNVIWSSNQAPR